MKVLFNAETAAALASGSLCTMLIEDEPADEPAKPSIWLETPSGNLLLSNSEWKILFG